MVLAGVPALFNHQAVLNALHYYLKRPTETGGIPAGLSMLFDWHGSTLVNTYHSINVVSAVARPIADVIEAIAVVGCLWVWWAQLKNRIPFEAACLAALTVAVLGSKVLSAQYVIWMMPLWALYRFRPHGCWPHWPTSSSSPTPCPARGSAWSPPTPSTEA